MKAIDSTRIPDTSSALEPPQHSRFVGADPQIAYTIYEPQNPVSGWQVGFLNGVAHQQNCWHQMALSLAQQGARCLSLDYRGVGMSQWSQPVEVSGPHDVMLADGWKLAAAVLYATLRQWEEDAA